MVACVRRAPALLIKPLSRITNELREGFLLAVPDVE
jgi:hypothetical protein